MHQIINIVKLSILAFLVTGLFGYCTNDESSDEKASTTTSGSSLTNGTASTCSNSNYSAPTTTTTATGKFTIPDTAQTDCFNSTTGAKTTCSGTGYDGDYNTTNQQSYTDNSDGTITDNVTGLMWTKSPETSGDSTVDSNDKKSYTEAVSYCENLSLAGQTDWRLPDIKTLFSLMNFKGLDPSGYTGTDTSAMTPFIDDTKFTVGYGDTANNERLIDGQYATTSIYNWCTDLGGGSAETMFGVNFVDGRIKGYPTSNKTYYVYCVRDNTDYGKNNFTDNGNQTISDSATGLMWHKNDQESTDFEDAISKCENDTTTGSHSDWRLPNVKELQSIVDYSRGPDKTNSAAIDSVFHATSFTNEAGQTEWGYYWASTTHATYDTNSTDDDGRAGSYVCFGRCAGINNNTYYDVHGAGAQRSNYKQDVSVTGGASTATSSSGSTVYYYGPQGDILRKNNMVRCVRNI